MSHYKTVQVGSPNTCELYSSLHDNEPQWGLTGEDKEITQHIMCCIDTKNVKIPNSPKLNDEDALASDLIHRPPSLEEDEQWKDNETPPEQSQSASKEKVESETKTKSTAIDEYVSTKETTESPAQTQSTTIDENVSSSESSKLDTDDSNKNPSQYISEHSQNDKPARLPEGELKELLAFYAPIWFDRSFGLWSGTNLTEAQEFCHHKAGKRSACPYIAYCPQGPMGSMSQKIKTDKDIEWAPMEGWNGHNWVGIGRENACSQATDESEFGVYGDVGDITGGIMCCKGQVPHFPDGD